MVPQSQHANNTTLLAPNEPPGTLPDLDSSTWGGGNRSRGEKGSVSLHEHPPGSTSGAAQLPDKERLWRCRWPQHQAPTSMEKSFLFLRRDLRAHPSPVVSPACSGPFSTRLWAPQPLGPSCAEPPSCHQQDVHTPFSTTKPEVRASVSGSPRTQHQPSPKVTDFPPFPAQSPAVPPQGPCSPASHGCKGPARGEVQHQQRTPNTTFIGCPGHCPPPELSTGLPAHGACCAPILHPTPPAGSWGPSWSSGGRAATPRRGNLLFISPPGGAWW